MKIFKILYYVIITINFSLPSPIPEPKPKPKGIGKIIIDWMKENPAVVVLVIDTVVSVVDFCVSIYNRVFGTKGKIIFKEWAYFQNGYSTFFNPLNLLTTKF